MQQSAGIFTAIKDPLEKNKILLDMIQHSSVMKIKALEPRADIFLAAPVSLIGGWLTCKLIGPLQVAQIQAEIILQFHLSGQKYISQVRTRIEYGNLELNFEGDLYRVQRREDFRLRLPHSYQGLMEFKMNGLNIRCKLVDISAGGCRLEIPLKHAVKSGETYPGLVKTADRDDLTVEMNVRHIVPHPEILDMTLVGIQFTNQTEIVKNRMAALVMDLYKDFFTKRA